MKFMATFASLLLVGCAPGNGPSVPGNPASVGELGFLPRDAVKGSLFKYYQPKAGSKWLNNWAARLDLTGVSWNDTRSATLISPSHIVMAAHYMRPAEVAVMFHDASGRPYERFITAVKPLAIGDVAVARLNLPLPPAIKHYRFASAADAAIDRPVIVSDQTRTLSVHRIEAITGGGIRFGYIPGLNPLYQRNLVVGDSGHPTFLLRNGELVLLETHSTGGPGAGPFYGDPAVQAAIRSAVAELGN